MAKAKGRPPKPERDDVTVKLDRTVAAKAKIIASRRHIPVAQLLTEMVKGQIDKAYAVVVREIDGKV